MSSTSAHSSTWQKVKTRLRGRQTEVHQRRLVVQEEAAAEEALLGHEIFVLQLLHPM